MHKSKGGSLWSNLTTIWSILVAANDSLWSPQAFLYMMNYSESLLSSNSIFGGKWELNYAFCFLRTDEEIFLLKLALCYELSYSIFRYCLLAYSGVKNYCSVFCLPVSYYRSSIIFQEKTGGNHWNLTWTEIKYNLYPLKRIQFCGNADISMKELIDPKSTKYSIPPIKIYIT